MINSNRSRIKKFIEETNNKYQFFKYIFIYFQEVIYKRGKEPTAITSLEELMFELVRKKSKKLICQG